MKKHLSFAFGLVVLTLAVAAPAAADPGRGAAVQCYLWANNASPAVGVAYVPSTLYSYNAVGRGQAITVTKTGTGVYTVTCKGVGGGAIFESADEAAAADAGKTPEQAHRERQAAEAAGAGAEGSGSWGPGGHVQVTAYGSEDADQCKVQSWVSGGADFSATVRCYNHAGAPADSRFDLLYVW